MANSYLYTTCITNFLARFENQFCAINMRSMSHGGHPAVKHLLDAMQSPKCPPFNVISDGRMVRCVALKTRHYLRDHRFNLSLWIHGNHLICITNHIVVGVWHLVAVGHVCVV